MPRQSSGRRDSADSPATLTWLLRFEVGLAAECDEVFGTEWVSSVDPETRKACVSKGPIRICVALHPGLHVVAPMWAAQRIADQLHLCAITAGHVAPPTGNDTADEPRRRPPPDTMEQPQRGG